ncbi:MAG TPA: MopE-related protein, partial [Candidatus Polarisedimenticolia bacterium]|nr:MopE-related protein [Candidatus Polarisedimenticolia bacterium]
EVCDGLDNDCNNSVDDGLGQTTCGTGACLRSIDGCVGGVPQTCVPGSPAAEVCDNLDNDCDGSTDEGLGTATCGVGACNRTVENCQGGVTQTCVPGAPSSEICNGIDDDCDGMVDDGVSDTDFDGFPDCRDNCPLVWNPDQSDVNSDGIGDACEDAVLFTGANLSMVGFSSNRIDGRDLMAFAEAFGTCPGQPGYDPRANLDQVPIGAGPPGVCVDLTDFHLFMEEFAKIQ